MAALSFSNPLVERARQAAPGSRPDKDLVVYGWAEFLGAEGRFNWRFAPESRFLLHEDGPRPRTIGATERQVWIRDGSAPARELVWGDADQARLVSAVLCGDWAEPSSGVVVTSLADGKLRLTLGRREAVLTLDAATCRPRELEIHGSFGRPVWRFSAVVVPDTTFPQCIEQQLPAGLGPLTIDDPAFVEMDLAALSAHAGAEIAGIIGYDVLRRVSAEIEVAAPRLAFFDPATADEGLPWEEIAIYGNHVYARASFEGHEGWFRLDTGAPQVPILFNGPAVQRLSLLAGRESTEATIGVPGGTMKVAMGKVRGLWLGGHEFGPLSAIFPLESKGAFADEETLGNLGQDCFSPFRVRFDYARQRAAFVKRG